MTHVRRGSSWLVHSLREPQFKSHLSRDIFRIAVTVGLGIPAGLVFPARDMVFNVSFESGTG